MFFFFKQKTAYEMRISDWSSDVCSSDLRLYSEPGRGTTIKIYLKVPADADRTVKTRGVATPAREAVGGHEKILLVEDDERVREHVIGQLQEQIGRASCRERVLQYV